MSGGLGRPSIAPLRGEPRRDVAALQAAITARETGVEFLRREIASRDTILRSRDEGIEFLRQEVAARDQVIAKLSETVRQLEAMLPWWRRQKG